MLAVHSVRQFEKEMVRAVCRCLFSRCSCTACMTANNGAPAKKFKRRRIWTKKGNDRNGMYNILATDSQRAFHVTTPQTHKINYLSSKSASTHNYWTNKHLHCPSHSICTEPCTHLLLFWLLLLMLELQSLPCCTIPFADSLPMYSCFRFVCRFRFIWFSFNQCVSENGILYLNRRNRNFCHTHTRRLMAAYRNIFVDIWLVVAVWLLATSSDCFVQRPKIVIWWIEFYSSYTIIRSFF